MIEGTVVIIVGRLLLLLQNTLIIFIFRRCSSVRRKRSIVGSVTSYDYLTPVPASGFLEIVLTPHDNFFLLFPFLHNHTLKSSSFSSSYFYFYVLKMVSIHLHSLI